MIALCCHHRCEWSPYVGKEFLTEQGEGYRSRLHLLKDFCNGICAPVSHIQRNICSLGVFLIGPNPDPTFCFDVKPDLDVQPIIIKMKFSI